MPAGLLGPQSSLCTKLPPEEGAFEPGLKRMSVWSSWKEENSIAGRRDSMYSGPEIRGDLSCLGNILQVWSNEVATVAREGGWSQNTCGLECCANFQILARQGCG